jgi:hypothetical protein
MWCGCIRHRSRLAAAVETANATGLPLKEVSGAVLTGNVTVWFTLLRPNADKPKMTIRNVAITTRVSVRRTAVRFILTPCV